MLHTLHAENLPFRVEDSFDIFFLCDFSAFPTKLIEFYYFLMALGRILIVFQAEKSLVYARGLFL